MIPYAIRGVLWDQGESYVKVEGTTQFTLMGCLIKSWRKKWGQDFPFIYVQKKSGGGCAWEEKSDFHILADKFMELPEKNNRDKDGSFRSNYIKIMEHPHTAMAHAASIHAGKP